LKRYYTSGLTVRRSKTFSTRVETTDLFVLEKEKKKFLFFSPVRWLLVLIDSSKHFGVDDRWNYNQANEIELLRLQVDDWMLSNHNFVHYSKSIKLFLINKIITYVFDRWFSSLVRITFPRWSICILSWKNLNHNQTILT